MPGLAGPFHLRPAVKCETQKIQELIMFPLGFCSAVWGWNRPLRSSLSSARPLRPGPRRCIRHTSSFNSLTLNSPFFIYPSHSLSHPRYYPILSLSTFALFCFTPSPSCLNMPLPAIIKHLTLTVQAHPQLLHFGQVLSAAWLCALFRGVGGPL